MASVARSSWGVFPRPYGAGRSGVKELAWVFVPDSAFKCPIFAALSLRPSAELVGGISGGVEGGAQSVDTGIITIQVASEHIRSKINPFISCRGRPRPIEGGLWMAALRGAAFEVWGSFERRVSLVSVVSVIKLCLCGGGGGD